MLEDMQARWDAAKVNGCTASPDLWMEDACNRHDRHYGTHHHRNGEPITRFEADWEMLKDARRDAPNFITRNTLPFFYFVMTRIFGWKFW